MRQSAEKVKSGLENSADRFSFKDLRGPSNALAIIASAGMALMTLGCSEKAAQSATPEWISENPSLLVGKELVTSGNVRFLEDQSYIRHHSGYTTMIPCGKSIIPIYHPARDENVTCLWYQISSPSARTDSKPLLILSSRSLEANTWKVQGEIKESKTQAGSTSFYFMNMSKSWYDPAASIK